MNNEFEIGGASSTTQQGGFIPPFEWVARLALAAIDAKKAVFIKTNFWNAGRLQEFPQP
jgi:hypothetical protein